MVKVLGSGAFQKINQHKLFVIDKSDKMRYHETNFTLGCLFLAKKFMKDVSFLSKIVHQIKSPAHAIASIGHYILENWKSLDDSIKKECLEDTLKSAIRMRELIDQLSDYSAVSDGRIAFKFEELSLKSILSDVIDGLRILLVSKVGVSIQVNNQVNDDKVIVDKIWFPELLTNILTNSIKFSSGGSICLTITEREIDSIAFYEFLITDQGIRIHDDKLVSISRVLSSGYQSLDQQLSKALGLAICSEIVQAHRGFIQVANHACGVTVSFRIPKSLDT